MFKYFRLRIPLSLLTLFLRQLATLLQSSVPLVNALKVLEHVYTHPVLRKVLQQLKHEVGSGIPFSQACAKQPRYFSALSCQLIKAGEQAAALTVVLDQLATYQEKMAQLKARVQKALFYPAIVLTVALVISLGLLLFIVPQFEQLFSSFGASLPWLTKLVLHLAQFIKRYGEYALLFLVIIMMAIIITYQRLPAVKAFIEYWRLYIPIIGHLQRQAIIARFVRTLAMLGQASVPLVSALGIAAEVTQHYHYRRAVLQARDRVAKGETLSQALQKTQYFSALEMQMIYVGEQSGQLNVMLQHVAQWYENQIDNTVANLSQCLEPFIMVFLGVLIGGLVIAMYLPIFQLGNVV